jgi:hypothetical protein
MVSGCTLFQLRPPPNLYAMPATYVSCIASSAARLDARGLPLPCPALPHTHLLLPQPPQAPCLRCPKQSPRQSGIWWRGKRAHTRTWQTLLQLCTWLSLISASTSMPSSMTRYRTAQGLNLFKVNPSRWSIFQLVEFQPRLWGNLATEIEFVTGNEIRRIAVHRCVIKVAKGSQKIKTV